MTATERERILARLRERHAELATMERDWRGDGFVAAALVYQERAHEVTAAIRIVEEEAKRDGE